MFRSPKELIIVVMAVVLAGILAALSGQYVARQRPHHQLPVQTSQ
jgi:hypothetical protein